MIDHLDAVELATRRVLEEFAADNVIYLELRTTPRRVDGKMEQVQHITKVLNFSNRHNPNYSITHY